MEAKAVLLTSGGLDSTTMAYWLLSQEIDFVPLFINYGQHCCNTELTTLKQVLPPTHIGLIEVIDISDIYKKSTSRFIHPANLWEENINDDELYIPYRNALLLTVGASFAMTIGVKTLYSAFINSNHAKELDCSNIFFNKMEGVLAEFGSVRIIMPFRDMTKYDVAKLGIGLGANIGATFSCQASPIIPCGACPNCVDRLDALNKLSQF